MQKRGGEDIEQDARNGLDALMGEIAAGDWCKFVRESGVIVGARVRYAELRQPTRFLGLV